MTWTVLADSVIGTAHRGRGLPCQDAFRWARASTDGATLLVAVADGAGSAALADVGATRACDAYLEAVRPALAAGEPVEAFHHERFLEVLAAVRAEVLAEADRRQARPRDLACTGLFAVVGPDAAAFAQIGDGAILVGVEQRFEPVFWPRESEYANSTDFLTEDGFAANVQTALRPGPVTALAALTDGLQRVALDYAARTGHAGFFQPLFRRLRDAADPEVLLEPFRQFLDSPRINERTDDDKTLVLALRTPPHEPTPTPG